MEKSRTFYHKEKISSERARYILGLPQENLIDDIYDAEERNEDGKKWNMDTYFSQIKYYLNHIIKKDGIYNQSYKYSKNMKTEGRQYVKNFGIQSLQRDIRGFLCCDYYNDYDIVNAHPTILYYIQKTMFPNLQLPCLEKYINDRDNILKEWKITKKDILICINSEKIYNVDSIFLIRLHKEMVILQNEIWESNHEKISSITKRGLKTNKNKKGCFINRVLCVFENDIICKALSKFNTSDIGSVMFDGFFLNKELNKDEVIETLTNTTAEYGIKWSVKNHSDKIKIVEALNLPPSYSETDYDQKKTEFEKTNFIVLDPLMFVTENDYNNDENSFTTYNWFNFKKAVAPIKYSDDKCDDLPFVDDWVEDIDRREYRKFVFDPENTDDKYYNLFTGFNFTNIIPEEQRDQDHVDAFVNHVKYLLRHDEKTYEYILNYCSHIIQKPHERPDVCIVLNGAQGTGKDLLITILEKIVGKKYVSRTSKMEEIFGNFNTALKHKLILQINEMEGKNGVKYEQMLKDQITAETITINGKMKEPYDILNLIRIFICSNGDNPIKMGMANRRYFVGETATFTEKKPLSYFKELSKLLRDDEFLESVFSYLMSRDIEDFEPRDFPETKKMKIMKEHSVNPLYLFLEDNFTTQDHTIPCKTFVIDYREFCNTEGYKSEFINAKSVKSLLLNMGNDCVKYTVKRMNGSNTRVYEIDYKKMKQELIHRIPQ